MEGSDDATPKSAKTSFYAEQSPVRGSLRVAANSLLKALNHCHVSGQRLRYVTAVLSGLSGCSSATKAVWVSVCPEINMAGRAGTLPPSRT